eukprot:269276-Rhodomonas_salina.1
MASSLENSAHNGAAEEVEEHGDEGGEGEEEGLTSDVANNSVEDELSGRDPGKGPHHHMPPPLPPLDMAGGARGVVNAQMIRSASICCDGDAMFGGDLLTLMAYKQVQTSRAERGVLGSDGGNGQREHGFA